MEGVEAWNARRDKIQFEPDFTGFDLISAFEGRQIDLSNANFRFANMEHATLKNAKMRSADFSASNLNNSNFSGAILRGALFDSAKLRNANFQNTSLKAAHFEEADLRSAHLMNAKLDAANFKSAKLSGADFSDASLHGTAFSKADATSNIYGIFGGTRRDVLRTNFMRCRHILQRQLDCMLGDDGTLIPEDLERPTHWPRFNLASEYTEFVDPNSSKAEQNANSIVKTDALRQRLSTSSTEITLSGVSLLELIASFREEIRTNNQLAAEHGQHRDNILDFLDSIVIEIEGILQNVPQPLTAPTDEQVSKTESYANQFMESAKTSWKDHCDPEKVGKMTVPAGIILACGTFGYLVTGLNPIGLGTGVYVGKWITGEMKSGVAVDKLREHFTDQESSDKL